MRTRIRARHEKAVTTLVIDVRTVNLWINAEWLIVSAFAHHTQARKALADRQKDLEVKTQQLEIKLSNKTEEDIKKARRKSTQAGQRSQSRSLNKR